MGLTRSCQKKGSAQQTALELRRRQSGVHLVPSCAGCLAGTRPCGLMLVLQPPETCAHCPLQKRLGYRDGSLGSVMGSKAAGCCLGSRAEAVLNLGLLWCAGPCIMSSKAAQHGTLDINSVCLTCSHCCSMVLCM